ncbi:hypothetical protein [Phormidium sp. CCY1219]|uniref:hypothetical protein n=1 Tax=Phormidium sp. CCY1219 TaxID=2886104 RepID=UPI002D1EB18D|nr:hypothetical protein [Phormidium sp. CCY1219]MEB3830611.1 hypothetical protein [Phormidium sp. CCY1219]
MTEVEKNTQESNPQKSGIWESFSQSFAKQIGTSIGFFIIPAIGILILLNTKVPIADPIVEVTAVTAGAAAAAILPAVTGVPLIVAVGVGIVLWWIISSVMS